jgi:NAD(P)H-dependent FMN reductase
MLKPTLAIIWHSRTGGAREMARMIAEGAGEGGRLIAADQGTAEDLLTASGYVFVCPENLGSMSGVMKDMFDRVYYPLLGRIEGRPYATAIAVGSGGQGTQAQIDRIVSGWRLRRIAEPLIVDFGAQTPEAILAPKSLPPGCAQQCHDLGATLVEGLQMGVF